MKPHARAWVPGFLAFSVRIGTWEVLDEQASVAPHQEEGFRLHSHANWQAPWLVHTGSIDPFADFYRLIASGKPKDLWQAHQQAMGCRCLLDASVVQPLFVLNPEKLLSAEFTVYASTGKELPFSIDRPSRWAPPEMTVEQCKHVPQQDSSTLSQWTLIAASEGIPDAVFWYALMGPFDDRTALVTRPDDPLVIEWRDKVLAMMVKAVRDGDLEMVRDADTWMQQFSAFEQDRQAHYQCNRPTWHCCPGESQAPGPGSARGRRQRLDNATYHSRLAGTSECSMHRRIQIHGRPWLGQTNRVGLQIAFFNVGSRHSPAIHKR